MITQTYFLVLEVLEAAPAENRHFPPKFDIFRPFKRIFDENDLIFFSKFLEANVPYGKLKKRRLHRCYRRKPSPATEIFLSILAEFDDLESLLFFSKKFPLKTNPAGGLQLGDKGKKIGGRRR